MGCSTHITKWFHSYLSQTESRTLQDNTKWKDVTRGVPQGGCLSPILFNVYVRELPASCSSNTFQFADDITHNASDNCPSKVIEKLVDSFSSSSTMDVCTDHELIINKDNAQFILFKNSTKKIPDGLHIVLDNCEIQILK